MYNSKKHGRKQFNAARYAAFVRKIREIRRLFPEPKSGLAGWSQLESDPNTYLLPRAAARVADHWLNGCDGEIIPGKKNPDGSPARQCRNPECDGTWRGPDFSSMSTDDIRRTAQIMGITQDKEGKKHFPGDSCSPRSHEGHGLLANMPTVADYAKLKVRVPGKRRPTSVMELMAKAHTMVIGQDEHGPIVPGRYMIDRTRGEDGTPVNQPRVDSALLRSASAARRAGMGMLKLVHAGETDLGKYWQVAKDVALHHFQAKRKEFDPSDPDPEETVGYMPGVARKDPGHVVMDGTLRNIRNTLGDGALIETDPRDRQLWDMMSTVRTTQTFNPHHIFDEHANHLNHVIDVQHADELAKSKVPGVRHSFFAGFPQSITGTGNMAELGNVGKRDPFGVFWRSGAVHDLVHRLVRDHIERQNPMRMDSGFKDYPDFVSQSDVALQEAINREPDRFERIVD